MSTPTAHSVPYRERLHPTFWIWLLLVVGVGSFGIVGSRFGAGPGFAGLALSAVVLVPLLLRAVPTVEIADGVLWAGRANVPVRLLGPATALDAEGMRAERGPALDARAYLCLRGWVSGGVRVPLHDPRDPAPYWLVSSRRPGELAAALDVAGARPATEAG